MAKAKAEAAAEGAVQAAPEPAKQGLYVSAVDREIAFGTKVFMFQAGVPRQLPEPAVRYCVGMGIEEI